jgi:kinesin family protein 23
MDADGEVPVGNPCVVSQLSLVDLAGSERNNRTGTTGERLKEASNINNSLMSLRNCLDILRENQKCRTNKAVPYRENKLTHLFKNYFEGEGHVSMIICLNPSADEYDETIHVLKFAETAQEVLVTRPNGYNFQIPLISDIAGVQFASYGTVGPAAPQTTLTDPNDEKVVPEWLDFLEQHKSIRLKKTEELLQNQLLFRKNLGEMESEVMCLRQENSQIRNDLTARQEQVVSLQSAFSLKEREVETVQRKQASLERKIADLTKQLKSSRDETKRVQSEKEDMAKQHMDTLRLESRKIRKFYEDKLAEIETQLKKENFMNVERMDLIRQIISGSSDIRSLQETIAMRPSSPPSNVVTASASTGSTAPKAPSTPEHRRRSSRAASQDRSRRAADQRKSAPESPITLSGAKSPEMLPVMNPRHRRSLSTGAEKWLDHRPSGTLDLGTVFQPKIRNKKSFSNMKEVTAETFNHASHYALTHHMADVNGEVETRVYKGDIIPSTGGGAHVIFNDIETLTQEDPHSPGFRSVINQFVSLLS